MSKWPSLTALRIMSDDGGGDEAANCDNKTHLVQRSVAVMMRLNARVGAVAKENLKRVLALRRRVI